jgi:predicted dehydrogenase
MWLQFASFVFGGERPLKVLAGGHVNDDGVDESVSVTFVYAGGRTASFATHTKVIP